MGSVRRKHLIALMVPAFLAAQLLCICAQSALAAPETGVRSHEDSASSKGSHDCCHRKGGTTPKSSESTRCQHCLNPQLNAPDSVKLSAPLLHALPAFLSTSSILPALVPIALHAEPLRGTHSPPRSVHLLKCVLLV